MLIHLKNAVKKYGSGEAQVYALDHAELALDQGEICVILGPSGSGKSTLLNMLGGLDTLDEGELTVAGRKVTGLSQERRTDYRREDVGFVFQFYNLIPDLTVEELKFVEKMNRRFGTTVVIITHNEAIAGMADRVIRLKDGRICENLGNERKIPAAELVL